MEKNMENTMEILSGKLVGLEKAYESLSAAHNETVKLYDSNFATILGWRRGQKRFNKLTFVAAVCGAYMLYKQNKEIKELKAKSKEQENIEE